MNRVTVEAGITRLTNELTAQRQTIEANNAKLTELDKLYRDLTEMLDVHGEDVQADIDKLTVERTTLRRQNAESESAITDLNGRLKVVQEALRKVEYEEGRQQYQALADHAALVRERYHRAIHELHASHREIHAYQMQQVQLRRKLDSYARAAGDVPLPALPNPVAYELWKDTLFRLDDEQLHQHFPVSDSPLDWGQHDA